MMNNNILLINCNKTLEKSCAFSFTLAARIGDFLLLTYANECITNQRMGRILVLSRGYNVLI